jgi:3-isopropylmalate/(R)-2-methylmalate dehydratase large subunit
MGQTSSTTATASSSTTSRPTSSPPGWVCYYYDETLARYCLVGLRGGNIEQDAIKNGGFKVIVSGRSKGCGSSRETAPYSELKAGIQLVVARNIEKIYGQNCQNIGLLTTTDFTLLERSSAARRSRSTSSRRASTDRRRRSCATGAVCLQPGAAGGPTVPARGHHPKPRPMTLCEKIIAPTRWSTPRRASSACPPCTPATRSSCAPTCASATST